MRKIAVLFISAVTALTSFAPAQAFPTVARTQTAQSDIIQVGDHAGRQIIRRNHRGSGWDHNRNDRWDRDRHDDRRGYYRDDYRRRDRNNNAAAIIGGLAAGAIIGGAIASQPRYSNGNAHTQSCYARYRSYRASDNTYQPNYGPRRQCN